MVKEVLAMGLREIRKNRNITQRELAQRSGINFRSLQDYEQGHKNLASANGDTLLRLSTTLGCSMEDLLLDDSVGAPILPTNRLNSQTIQGLRFYCEKYQTAGRWVCSNNHISTLFYYDGTAYRLPFQAVFTPAMLPCFMDAAVLQMEAKIEEIRFRENEFESW